MTTSLNKTLRTTLSGAALIAASLVIATSAWHQQPAVAQVVRSTEIDNAPANDRPVDRSLPVAADVFASGDAVAPDAEAPTF